MKLMDRSRQGSSMVPVVTSYSDKSAVTEDRIVFV